MKKLFLILIVIFSINLSVNGQQLFNTVKQKVEIELQKRLTNTLIGTGACYECANYVYNTLSITSANQSSDGTVTFQAKISVECRDLKCNQLNETERKTITGSFSQILDSWEIKSFQIWIPCGGYWQNI